MNILPRFSFEAKIYNYFYHKLFPFKVFLSSKSIEFGTLVHSKIYVIDDEIAYMGSLNFTKSGTKHNYETRIRTTSIEAIKEINEELKDLYNYSDIPEADIQLWGRKLYSEPLN